MSNVRALNRQVLVDPSDEARLVGFAGAGIYFGTGTPEGTFAAVPGSIYFRMDSTLTGVSGIFRKPFAAGAGTTGWVSDQQSVAILTPEGGLSVWLTNKTGAPSVKGQVVTAGGESGGVVVCPFNIAKPIGVFYSGGVADGDLARVVISGLAEVLFENGQSPTAGYWVGLSDSVDGRAQARATMPDNSGAGVDLHNKEIGHCIDTVASGTDVLARVVLHFN